MALRLNQMLRSTRQLRQPSANSPAGSTPAAPARPPVPAGRPTVDAPLGEVAAVPEDLGSPQAEDADTDAVFAAFARNGARPEAAAKTPAAPVDAPDISGPMYRRLVAAAESVFKAAIAQKAPDAAVLTTAVKSIYTLLGRKNTLLAEIVRQHGDSHTLPERSANTAILSMRLGMELNYDERRILALGLCALMHDLGMLMVPPEMLQAPRLSQAQLQVLKNHPVESQKMVEAFGPSFTWIGKIVVQVHERRDGGGYPQGLRGEQIRDLAGVIGLADTYAAMTHPRVDREARAVYHALKEIIDLRNTLFDRRLVKALISIVSIFPLGSLVQLNNGEIGRVIDTSKTHPTRPVIEVLLDAKGRQVQSQRLVDLKNEPMLYIVDPAIKEGVLQRK